MDGYFDYNATTPLHPAARAAMLAAEDRHWHNASGLYREAAAAKIALEDAREALADYLQVEAEEIIFTSGATEANNAVVQWLALANTTSGHFFSQLEHPSLREPARAWLGERCQPLEVSQEGIAQLPRQLPVGSVVSVMAANNETGILQPWQSMAAACAEQGCFFHCDAAQWFGKMEAQDWSGCDFLTGSAHKFGGPKGVGFLRVSPRIRKFVAQRGGPQEARRRAGTENVPAILGMLAALNAAPSKMTSEGRDAFERRLAGFKIIGQNALHGRLPNTSLVILPHGKNTQWLARLSTAGFATSTGSACSSGQGASEVLTAMGLPPEEMSRVLRLSGGPTTTVTEWEALAAAMINLTAG